MLRDELKAMIKLAIMGDKAGPVGPAARQVASSMPAPKPAQPSKPPPGVDMKAAFNASKKGGGGPLPSGSKPKRAPRRGWNLAGSCFGGR